MSNHIHFIAIPNENQTISELVRQVKSNSSKAIAQLLTPSERSQLSSQVGLNRSQIWRAGLRANPLVSTGVYREKLNYLHQNPVRAGLVESAEEYLWSSQWLLEKGYVNGDGFLMIPECIAEFDRMLRG